MAAILDQPGRRGPRDRSAQRVNLVQGVKQARRVKPALPGHKASKVWQGRSDPRVSKVYRVPLDPKDNRDPRVSKVCRGPSEPKDIRDPRVNKVSRALLDPKDNRDPRAIQVQREILALRDRPVPRVTPVPLGRPARKAILVLKVPAGFASSAERKVSAAAKTRRLCRCYVRPDRRMG